MINQQSYWLLLACLCAVAAVSFASDDVTTAKSTVEETPATEAASTSEKPVEEPSTASSVDVAVTDEAVTPTYEASSDDYGSRLMNAVSKLDEQVKADIEPMAENTWMDPNSYIPPKEMVMAIVDFVEREMSKPEGERRYRESNVFEDMMRVLTDDCKLVNEAFGNLITEPTGKELNEQEIQWYINGKICKQMENKMPSTLRIAETQVAQLVKQAN